MSYTNFQQCKKGYSILRNETLKAVIEDDLVSLLVSLGVHDNIMEEKETCLYCDRIIHLDNIEALVPINHSVRIVCSSSECRNKLLIGED